MLYHQQTQQLRQNSANHEPNDFLIPCLSLRYIPSYTNLSGVVLHQIAENFVRTGILLSKIEKAFAPLI